MILGYDFFGEPNYSPNITNKPNYMTAENAQYDQIRVDSEIPDTPISFEKKEWTDKTVMQTTFEGSNLESGTVGADGKEVEKIIIKRKRVDDINWVPIAEKLLNEIEDNIFVFIDKTANPVEKYEYAVVASDGTSESTNYNTKTIDTEMDGCYIYDKDKRYELYYNFSFGDFKHIMPSEILETMGGRRFPVVVYNGDIKYAKGSIKSLLFASEDKENIDFYKEKKLREEIMEFIYSRKPKAIKAYDGTNMMIAITSDPTLSSHSKGTYQLSFDFVEIGDMNNGIDLYKNNFTDIPVDKGGTHP